MKPPFPRDTSRQCCTAITKGEKSFFLNTNILEKVDEGEKKIGTIVNDYDFLVKTLRENKNEKRGGE